jgi:hypothetical protein
MKKHLKQLESGQAIILIAVAVVGLLGAVALAVDGSMIYSDRNSMRSRQYRHERSRCRSHRAG